VGPVSQLDDSSSLAFKPLDAWSAGFSSVKITPLFRSSVEMHLLHPVGHNCVELACLIVDVSQNHHGVSPEMGTSKLLAKLLLTVTETKATVSSNLGMVVSLDLSTVNISILISESQE